MRYLLYDSLMIFFRVIEFALFGYCVLSWFARGTRIYHLLERFLEPLLHPFRLLSQKLMGRFGLPVDFSPILLLIALDILREIAIRVFF